MHFDNFINMYLLYSFLLLYKGLKKENRLSCEIIPQLIKDLLNHEMITHPSFGIRLGRGMCSLVLSTGADPRGVGGPGD